MESEVAILILAALAQPTRLEVFRLLVKHEPEGLAAGDIARARKETNATVLLGRNDDALLASVLVGHDGHRGWVYYVTVDPDHRHKGYGREIMTAAENWLRARGIEKLQLMVRGDNAKVHAFYRSLGYYDQERVVFAKWLDGREPTP